MEQMKIAVCDDEQIALSLIKRILTDDLRARDLSAEIDVFTDAEKLLEKMKDDAQYDLILLDIDMPKMDGIEFGIRFSYLKKPALLIYISNREDKVYASFKAAPFRFVRKANLRQEWTSVMNDAIQEIQCRKKERLSYEYKGTILNLYPEDIIYIESFRKKQLIHTKSNTYELGLSFHGLLEQIEPLGFIQIHKSYIVNYRYIRCIYRTELELDDHSRLPVGRAYAQAVRNRFQQMVM